MKKILFIYMLFCVRICPAQTTTFYGTHAGYQSNGSNTAIVGHHAGIYSKGLVDGLYGHDNSFIGAFAGAYNRGAKNTFVGSQAGQNNFGEFNLFLGELAGYRNSGDNMIALGSNAAHSNRGAYSIFIGNSAGLNHKGSDNIAIGHLSGNNGVSGRNNTFIGSFSGVSNTIGSDNIFMGFETGKINKGGSYNIYLGSMAGKQSLGNNNVFIGYKAGYSNSASNKLIIANEISNSIPLITGDFQAKHVAIGGTGDTHFTLHVLGSVYATGNYTSSDKRFKKNIQPIKGAREKLLTVKGVSYEFKPDSIRNFHQGKTYGFIAQDVQKIMPALVKEDQHGYLSLNYNCFIPLLVEGYKELATENKQLKDKNAALEARLNAIELKISNNKNIGASGIDSGKSLNEQSNVLYQNMPNPFSESTTIEYEMWEQARQISLHIYDLNGKELLTFSHLSAGKNAVIIQANKIPAGMYLYSLVADGKVADTKRMILTK